MHRKEIFCIIRGSVVVDFESGEARSKYGIAPAICDAVSALVASTLAISDGSTVAAAAGTGSLVGCDNYPLEMMLLCVRRPRALKSWAVSAQRAPSPVITT